MCPMYITFQKWEQVSFPTVSLLVLVCSSL